MKKVYSILLVFIQFVCLSQNPLFFHTRFGSDQDDKGMDIIQTMDSQYVAVGYTNGYNVSQTDILVAKTNKLGVPIWQKTFGGISADIGKSIIELPDSSLVFTGYSNSFGAGGYDAIIFKTDKTGNLIWRKTFGGLDWDFAYSISKTLDGNLIICGATYSYGRGGSDGFLLKLDYNGNFLWDKIYGSKKDDDLKKVITTNEGGYIAVGTTKGYGDSLGDIWVTKFNAQGDSTWFKTNGGIKMEIGNSVVQDVNNDYLICGGSESFSFGKEDAYIFKLNNSGNFVWNQFYGLATKDEESYDVVNSKSTYGSMVITFGTREQSAYQIDIKTLLLDFNGYYVRGGSFGGPNIDIGYALYNTFDKGYVACGYTESFNAIMSDFFIVKYDSEMTIGPLIVSLKELSSSGKQRLYPTFVENHSFRIETEGAGQLPVKIEVVDVYGVQIKNLKIEEIDSGLLQISLPENVKGVIIVNVNDGKLIKKCLVQ